MLKRVPALECLKDIAKILKHLRSVEDDMLLQCIRRLDLAIMTLEREEDEHEARQKEKR